MNSRELLINSLYRQFEKDRILIKKTLLQSMNEVAIVTHQNKKKITMIIKIEDDK